MNSVIEVNNLSKKYRITHQRDGCGTLRDVLTNMFKKSSPKEDLWALKDISFNVEQGEAIGIIGPNGAGKTTLLKILSRITPPTKGKIKLKGRTASLLEVGTGFHPELTGRENIFLNGAILGMGKVEIRKKFDQIVDFAGIEKFLDTPVKRYSSGMSVRLAFAVAAHMEPDILLIDEVLAVGDAEFQKKSLGKMDEAKKRAGRTILFVSHNMTAIKSLCSKAILLRNGMIADSGDINQVINNYLSETSENSLEQSWNDMNSAPGNEDVKIKSIKVIPKLKNNMENITIETPVVVQFELWNLNNNNNINLCMDLYSATGELVFASISPIVNTVKGLTRLICHMPENLLNDGVYYIRIVVTKNASMIFALDKTCTFEVKDVKRKIAWFGKWPGAVRPKLKWNIQNK